MIEWMKEQKRDFKNWLAAKWLRVIWSDVTLSRVKSRESKASIKLQIIGAEPISPDLILTYLILYLNPTTGGITINNIMISRSLIFLVTVFVWSAQAFAPVTPAFRSRHMAPTTSSFGMDNAYAPPSLVHQRKSMASVQTMGLFGLGAPEVAIILVAAAFLLGPQKLAELGKDAGKIAGELKEVPKEFQKGLSEGEELAKANKQKVEEEK